MGNVSVLIRYGVRSDLTLGLKVPPAYPVLCAIEREAIGGIMYKTSGTE